MRVYLIVFIVTLLIQFIPVENDKQYLRRVILTFIPMFLFGALRVDFGLDYPTYEAEFLDAHKYSDISDISEHSEIGYVLFERIVPSWRLLIVLTSALTCIAYGSVFYKCVPKTHSWIAVCLLFLAGDKTIFFQFSGIRNAMAIAIMYLVFPLIRDRKLIPYCLLLLLATTFHTTAVFIMPLMYILCRGKDMTKKEALVWILVMCLLQIVNLDFVFGRVSEFVNTYVNRYDNYAEIALERGDNRSFLMRSFVAIFVLLIVRFMRTTRLNESENTLCRMALVFMLFYIMGSLNPRVPQYLGFSFVCAATVILAKWQYNSEKMVFGVSTLVFLFYSFFIVWMRRPEFPYQTYYSIFG